MSYIGTAGYCVYCNNCDCSGPHGNLIEESINKWEIRKVDKKIKKLEKVAEKEVKGLKSLEKADKKRDKVCEMGEKAMKMKKKK